MNEEELFLATVFVILLCIAALCATLVEISLRRRRRKEAVAKNAEPYRNLMVAKNVEPCRILMDDKSVWEGEADNGPDAISKAEEETGRKACYFCNPGWGGSTNQEGENNE